MKITSITKFKVKAIQKEKVKFSIRLKLLLIITGIIIVSMTSMILLVTFFYKKNSEVLIQEYNLSLARLAASQLESNLKSLNYKLQTYSLNYSPKENKLDLDKANLFLKQNPNFFYVGFYHLEKKEFLADIFNEKSLTDSNLEKTFFPMIHELFEPEWEKVKSGNPSLINVSAKFSQAVLALAVKSDSNPELAVLLYFTPNDLLNSFESSIQTDIFEVFLITETGNLVLDSKLQETIKPKNKSDIPIIKKYLTSNLNNSSQKYQFNGEEFMGSYQVIDFANLAIFSIVESDKIFEGIYQIQKRNIVLTILILTISFLIIYVFASSISKPILDLVKASEEIEIGNFDLEIESKSRDEVGKLAESFLNMAKGLKERENIKNTFGKFVNKEIAEKALHGELQLGGTKKRCAIFFSDLRNFTGISESLEAEKVVAFLNEYFSEMVECIYDTNGIVDKFIGDAIMAHWGAIYSGENDTESAIDAALQMRKSLLIFNFDAIKKKRPILKFGCGINTGDVVAGQIGSSKKLEYTVIGDAVNLASRIEYLNKEFLTDILISEYSYNEVKDIYNFAPMEPIKIRGKSEPQKIFAVLGRKEDSSSPKNLDELRKLIRLK